MSSSLTRDIGVREILWDPPLVNLELQCIHFINVSGHPEDKTQHSQLHSVATRGTSTSIITQSPCPVANPLHMYTQLASNVAWWLKVLCSLFAVLL